ncbi:hypothetical protein TEA_003474 [Camellia sinensis var. sinensis]|uniref:Uncharacterized protein n=1 Tax=Camellia sinensis var. sinensis TaxID=542762 RepID=A0A4S4DNR4_CAMSN|nr:hypothetical protein TEA_003474 [Camellia sinensis var. sinensis]
MMRREQSRRKPREPKTRLTIKLGVLQHSGKTPRVTTGAELCPVIEKKLVDSLKIDKSWDGQSHATHDDDQLVAQYQPVLEELSWFPEKYLAELNLPFVTEGPAVQTSQLPYSGYISKPESPNPQLPTSSAEFYCENNTMVAQGLSCPGRNIDYLWNRNKPFPSEKEHLVESPEKLTWIGDFGFVAQEPLPGNIPSSCEDVYFQNHTQVAQGLRSAGGFTPLPSVGDHCNQTVPPHLVETSYASLNPPLINNGNSNGADLGLPLQCKRAKLCSKGKDQRRPYNKFRLDETDELTEGVQKYAGMHCCWIKIKDEYFKNDPHRTPDNLKVFKAQTDMDLNLLPNRGPAEDLPGSSLSIDRSVAILYQMIEEDDGFPT